MFSGITEVPDGEKDHLTTTLNGRHLKGKMRGPYKWSDTLLNLYTVISKLQIFNKCLSEKKKSKICSLRIEPMTSDRLRLTEATLSEYHLASPVI